METTAWVESPLQLLGALEHAGLAAPSRLTIIPRGGDAQLERTAGHVADRIAGRVVPGAVVGVDRRFLSRRRFRADAPWIVGDAYSGQVQAHLDRVEPSTLTLVDDGAITRRLAQQLRAGEPLLRPQPPRLLGALRYELAARTTRRLRRLAAEGRLAVTTFLDPDDPAVIALRELGASVMNHRFDVVRQWGERARMVPDDARIVLGTARVADGIDDRASALERLRHRAAAGPVAYVPHRREPQWFLTDVARIPDVSLVEPRLPVELAFGGADRPLEIVSGPSTAAETLPIVLRGTGSTIVLDAPSTEAAR